MNKCRKCGKESTVESKDLCTRLCEDCISKIPKLSGTDTEVLFCTSMFNVLGMDLSSAVISKFIELRDNPAALENLHIKPLKEQKLCKCNQKKT